MDIKEAVELTIKTNYTVLDERFDKFNQLTDSNLSGLRNALLENREVYITHINKSNIDQEARMNGLVDDLEQIANEVREMEVKFMNTGTSTDETTGKLTRDLSDLEAHLNTSIITERSVRKAHNK